MQYTKNSLRWSLLWAIILTACSLGPVDSPPPTSTGVRIAQASLIPASTRDLQIAPSRIPEPTPTLVEGACVLSAGLSSTSHIVAADIDYAERRVDVQHNVHFINRTNDTFEQIVFNVEPNRLPGAFTLYSVSSSLPLEIIEVVGRRMTLNLVDSLLPGCGLEISLNYTLVLPPISSGISGLIGYFGYSNRQLNLGHWLPTLALYRAGEWVTHDVTVIGEQLAAEVADWDITLRVHEAPNELSVAAPGVETILEDDQWRYVLEDSREFALSLSPFFRKSTAFTDQGVEVVIYSFDNAIVDTPNGRIDGAQQALEAAIQSLSMYADLYGDYIGSRFIIVQGDFPDGMEFSQLVFVSDQWFRTNPGTAESYLTIITVHEVSHQWWYARVGNDQALSPWLDEALATYSEYVFYEEFHPDLKDWWWDFRVAMFLPDNYVGKRVDSTVYEFATVREYINAVYLRGAHMLHEMRELLGTDAFFDLLRRYSDIGTNRVVNGDVFWSMLTPEQIELTRSIRENFLRGNG